MLKATAKEPAQREEAPLVILNSHKDSQAISACHLLDNKEVAAFLNVKESTIRYWTHIGYIPHIKFQSLVRFRKTDIDAWLDQRTALGRTAAGPITTAKKISEEIAEDILNRPRRGRAPRAKL